MRVTPNSDAFARPVLPPPALPAISISTARPYGDGCGGMSHRPGKKPARPSVIDPHRAYLDRRWAEGCRNGAELARELDRLGARIKPRVVRAWATVRRRAGADRLDHENTGAERPWRAAGDAADRASPAEWRPMRATVRMAPSSSDAASGSGLG